MSCSPFDLRDYFLKELTDPEKRQIELHVKGCAPCREELDRLRHTETALFSLREEEIPQRIAFVSDKIFEPSPWRRAWNGFWGSTARLGFASAALLSAAIVVFALTRPAPAPAVPVLTQTPAVSAAEIQQRIQSAVDQAVAVTEARLEKKMEQQNADVRQAMRFAQVQLDLSNRRELLDRRLSYVQPGDLK